jgi:putative SOS response-associated peptidase YedK
MAEIHNKKKRMPVILEPDQEKNWLKGEEINDFKKCDVELNAVGQSTEV